ncbi:intracellular chloride channel [Aureococcus anophagefferens]|nr:intracellular chloride channel [Aureococcus anophagefferens]
MYGGVDEQDANACTSDVHVVSEFPGAVLCDRTRACGAAARPAHHAACAVHGGACLFVFGGLGGNGARFNDAWLLARGDGFFEWKRPKASGRPPSRRRDAVARGPRHVLLFGGLTKPKDAAAAAAVVHTVEVQAGASSVDPYVATASAMPCAVADASLAPPSRRSGVVCAVLGNERKVLAFGGFDGRLRRAHSDVWELAMDEETGGTWARLHDGVASNYVAGSMDRPKVPALAAFTKRHLAVLESDDGDRLDELLSVSVREAPGAGATRVEETGVVEKLELEPAAEDWEPAPPGAARDDDEDDDDEDVVVPTEDVFRPLTQEEEDEYREAGALESELAVVKASKDVVDQRVSYAHGAELCHAGQAVLALASSKNVLATGGADGDARVWAVAVAEPLDPPVDDAPDPAAPPDRGNWINGTQADAIGPAPAPDDEAEDASTKLFEPTYVPEVREAPPVDLLDAPKPSVALRRRRAVLRVLRGDGRRLLADRVDPGLRHGAGAVVLAKRKPFELATVICEPGAGALAAVAWAPEGPSLAVATEAGAVDAYAFKDGAWRKVAASPPGPEPLLAVDFSADGAFLRAATPSGVSYFAAPGADDEPAADDAGEGDDEAEAPKKKKAAPREYVVKECKVAAPDDVAAVDWAAKAAAPAESLDALQGAVEPPAKDEEEDEDEDAPKKAKAEPPPAVRPAPSGVRVTLKRPDGGHAPVAHAVAAALAVKTTPQLLLSTGAGDGLLVQWGLTLAPEPTEDACPRKANFDVNLSLGPTMDPAPAGCLPA